MGIACRAVLGGVPYAHPCRLTWPAHRRQPTTTVADSRSEIAPLQLPLGDRTLRLPFPAVEVESTHLSRCTPGYQCRRVE